MTIDSFNTLTIPEQDEVLIMHGKHLFKYNKEDGASQIYRLFDFFVKLRRNSSIEKAREIYSTFNNDDIHFHEHHTFALFGDF